MVAAAAVVAAVVVMAEEAVGKQCQLPNWNVLWKTGEEWRAAANTQAAKTMQTLPALRERLHVTSQPSTMGGVRIYTVTKSGTGKHKETADFHRFLLFFPISI